GVTEEDMAKDENLKFQNSILKILDSHLGGLLAEASLEEDFNGKAGQSTVLTSKAFRHWVKKGTVLGTFEDNRFMSESKKPSLKSVDILGLGTGYTEDVCSGIILGKELVNAPANVLTPGL
ncbi:hypothetical protein C3L33_02892, partial [Rhododendron williamsianum]